MQDEAEHAVRRHQNDVTLVDEQSQNLIGDVLLQLLQPLQGIIAHTREKQSNIMSLSNTNCNVSSQPTLTSAQSSVFTTGLCTQLNNN